MTVSLPPLLPLSAQVVERVASGDRARYVPASEATCGVNEYYFKYKDLNGLHVHYFVVGIGLTEKSVELGQSAGLELEDKLIDFVNTT